MRKSTFIVVSCFTLLITGCGKPPAPSPSDASAVSTEEKSSPRKQTLCEVEGWQRDVTAAACQPGQKVLFLPKRWGNEQLPVIFAALNCDMRYSIAMTNGGVACIYAPITVEEAPIKQTAPETKSEKVDPAT